MVLSHDHFVPQGGFDDVFGDHYKGQGRQMLLASNG